MIVLVGLQYQSLGLFIWGSQDIHFYQGYTTSIRIYFLPKRTYNLWGCLYAEN